jgi:uncharacterized protein (DUF2267 family)
MKSTGLDVFDSSIQRTHLWLKELMLELNWGDLRKTYMAFRCVLHSVRDQLPVTGAVKFGEQLPLLIRGFYFDRWTPEAKPAPLRTRNDFVAMLSQRFTHSGLEGDTAESVARAVFRLLDRKVTEGEIEAVQHLMPGAVLDLWPPTLRAA